MQDDWNLALMDAMEPRARDVVMDQLRRGHQSFREVRRQQLELQEVKIAASVKRLGEVHARDDLYGLLPDYEIPLLAQVLWAIKQKEDDMAAGIKGTTGYEIFSDPFWKRRYKRLNPGLCYREVKRGNSIVHPGGIVCAGKYARISGGAALRCRNSQTSTERHRSVALPS